MYEDTKIAKNELTQESDTRIEDDDLQQDRVEDRRYPKRDRKSKDFSDFEVYNVLHNDIEPSTVSEALNGRDREMWANAMKQEYLSFKENDAWTLVDLPKNAKTIKSKWIFKIKRKSNGEAYQHKARLVARGFSQKYGVDYNETFSPVVRHSTMRMLLALAVELNLDIDHMDVSTAFLNGELKETVYMEQPENFVVPGKEEKVCLLKRSIYGLKQSSKAWNEKLNNVLTSIKFKRLNSEPCVYQRNENGNICIIAVYVDDFLLFCNNTEEKIKIKKQLMSSFKMKDLGPVEHILGIHIRREGDVMYLDQSKYINTILKRFNMADCKPVSTPLDCNSKIVKGDTNCEENSDYPYQALVGCIMYLAVTSRPDIAHAASVLSQFNTCYTETHWKAAKRVLRYLKGTVDYCLVFQKTGEDLTGFVDADWGNNEEDRRSYSGYVFKLAGGPVSWESRKQRTVALSSTEAEYMAISDGTKEAKFLNNLLNELIGTNRIVTIFNDNQSAQRMSENHIVNNRTKHIDIRYHFIRQAVQEGIIRLEYQPTEDMIADALTKALPGSRYIHLLPMMGLNVKNIKGGC